MKDTKSFKVRDIVICAIICLIVGVGVYYILTLNNKAPDKTPSFIALAQREMEKPNSVTMQINPNEFVDIGVEPGVLLTTDYESMYIYDNGLSLQRTVLETKNIGLSFKYKGESIFSLKKDTNIIVPIQQSYTFYTNWDNKTYKEGSPPITEVEATVDTPIGVKITDQCTVVGSNENYLLVTTPDGFFKVNRLIVAYEKAVNEYSAKMEMCYRKNFFEYYNDNDRFYTRCDDFSAGVLYVNANTCMGYSAKGELGQALLTNAMYNK